MKTKVELLEEIVEKQDEYITYLEKLVKMDNILHDISISARANYKEGLASLKSQLAEAG